MQDPDTYIENGDDNKIRKDTNNGLSLSDSIKMGKLGVAIRVNASSPTGTAYGF